MITAIVIALGILGALIVVMILALCRISAISDRRMDEIRRQRARNN